MIEVPEAILTEIAPQIRDIGELQLILAVVRMARISWSSPTSRICGAISVRMASGTSITRRSLSGATAEVVDVRLTS